MRILITGGMGFIGCHVAQQLKNMGHEPITYDNYINFAMLDSASFQKLLDERSVIAKCKHIEGDIVDDTRVNDVMSSTKPDVVIHMAAAPRAKVVDYAFRSSTTTMTIGLTNVLRAAERNQVSRFVFVSSSMVYGDFVTDPIMEYEPCRPKGHYAILKQYGELTTAEFCNQGNMTYNIVRPSAVYGPTDVDDRVLPIFALRAIKGEDICVRGAEDRLDFTYVTDAATGIALAATSTHKNDTFNITAGNGIGLLEAAHKVKVITNSESKIIVEGRDCKFPLRGSLSIDKARSRLGYVPNISFDEGLNKYVTWLKQSIYCNPTTRPW